MTVESQGSNVQQIKLEGSPGRQKRLLVFTWVQAYREPSLWPVELMSGAPM